MPFGKSYRKTLTALTDLLSTLLINFFDFGITLNQMDELAALWFN